MGSSRLYPVLLAAAVFAATQAMTATASAANGRPTCHEFDETVAPHATTGWPTWQACSDPEGAHLTLRIVSEPAHGTATIFGEAIEGLSYTAAGGGYAGPDSFTYAAVDPDGLESAPATIRLTIPLQPGPRFCDATQFSFIVWSGADATFNALCAEQEPGSTLFVVDRSPAHGTVEIRPVSSARADFVVHADASYTGPDSFAWHAEGPSGARGDQQTTAYVVDPPGTYPAPTCTQFGDSTVPYDRARRSRFGCGGYRPERTWSIRVVTPPTHGTIVSTDLSTEGDFGVVYQPNAGYVGSDSYRVAFRDDPSGPESEPYQQQLRVVAPGPNRAPVCFSWTVVASEGYQYTPVRIHCRDPEGDPLTYEVVGAPWHGSAAVDLSSGGGISYRAPAGFSGWDCVHFRASDGELSSDLTPIEIQVRTPPWTPHEPGDQCLPPPGGGGSGGAGPSAGGSTGVQAQAKTPLDVPASGPPAPSVSGSTVKQAPSLVPDLRVGPVAAFLIAGADRALSVGSAPIQLMAVLCATTCTLRTAPELISDSSVGAREARTHRVRLRGPRLLLVAGAPRQVAVRVPAKLRRVLRGRRVKLRIVLTATDRAGRATHAARTFRVRIR